MNNYGFKDLISGEEFFIQDFNRRDATKLAYEITNRPKFLGIFSDAFVEFTGLDVVSWGDLDDN